MSGTILITGANGSLALKLVERLLEDDPHLTLLLTVRNASNSDNNTENLCHAIAQYSGARVSVRELDLADLTAVHSFSRTVAAEISAQILPPLIAIVCNAYYWNLNGPLELTQDGLEKTFQVSHVSQAALVLRLLHSFGPEGGRIVLFSSEAHWPGKNGLEKYPPAIPDDVELLAKPTAAEEPADYFGRGFQRYANSKLVITMWMYALNRHLEAVGPINDQTSSRSQADNSPEPRIIQDYSHSREPRQSQRLASLADKHAIVSVLDVEIGHTALPAPTETHGSDYAHGLRGRRRYCQLRGRQGKSWRARLLHTVQQGR